MWNKTSERPPTLKSEVLYILNAVDQISVQLHQAPSRALKTRILKRSMALLGRELGFKVYGNGIFEADYVRKDRSFRNREWLFDLQWYTEPDNVYDPECGYITTGFPMAMEIEWEIRRREDRGKNDYSAMKYDFQKVVATNADLQIVIFRLKRFSDLDGISQYIMKVLTSYENRVQSSYVLAVAVDFKTGDQHYKIWYGNLGVG